MGSGEWERRKRELGKKWLHHSDLRVKLDVGISTFNGGRKWVGLGKNGDGDGQTRAFVGVGLSSLENGYRCYDTCAKEEKHVTLSKKACCLA